MDDGLSSTVRSVKVRLDADVASYITKMEAAGKVTQTAFGPSSVSMRKNLDDVSTSLDDVADSAQDASKGLDQSSAALSRQSTAARTATSDLRSHNSMLRTLVGSALAVAPAFLPVTAGLSGLGIAAVAAGFGLVQVGKAYEAISKAQAAPTTANLAAQRKALDGLSMSGRALVTELQRLVPTYKDLTRASANAAAPGLLSAMQSLLKMAPELRPFLTETSAEIGTLLATGANSLEQHLPAILATMQRDLPEAEEAVKDFADALDGIVHAMAPMGQVVLPILDDVGKVLGVIGRSPIGPVLYAGVTALLLYRPAAGILDTVIAKYALLTTGARAAAVAETEAAVAATTGARVVGLATTEAVAAGAVAGSTVSTAAPTAVVGGESAGLVGAEASTWALIAAQQQARARMIAQAAGAPIVSTSAAAMGPIAPMTAAEEAAAGALPAAEYVGLLGLQRRVPLTPTLSRIESTGLAGSRIGTAVRGAVGTAALAVGGAGSRYAAARGGVPAAPEAVAPMTAAEEAAAASSAGAGSAALAAETGATAATVATAARTRTIPGAGLGRAVLGSAIGRAGLGAIAASLLSPQFNRSGLAPNSTNGSLSNSALKYVGKNLYYTNPSLGGFGQGTVNTAFHAVDALGGILGFTNKNQTFSGNVTQTDANLASLVSGGRQGQATRDFSKITSGMSAADAQKALSAFPQYKAAMDAAANSNKTLAQQIRKANEALADQEAETLKTATATSSAYEAETSWGAAVRAAQAQAKTAEKGFSSLTKAGQANRQTVSGLIDAWNNQSKVVQQNANRFEDAKGRMVAFATAAGATKAQIAGLLKQMDRPANLQLKLNGLAELRQAKALLDALHSKTITVQEYVHTRDMMIHGGGPQFADGGHVTGPGGPRSDSILARLSNGEFVVNAAATSANRGLLEQMNRRRYADGGVVRAPWDGAVTGPASVAYRGGSGAGDVAAEVRALRAEVHALRTQGSPVTNAAEVAGHVRGVATNVTLNEIAYAATIGASW